jgi:putative thiamine transport system ATP-binding protein
MIMTMPTTLDIRNLTIARAGQTLIAGLDLAVPAGDILTLMGASGSGKSTLLNWLIGALDPAFTVRGELWLNGTRRDTQPVEARRIGILFQDDLLFPHLGVGQNLAFALPAHIVGRAARRAVVERTLSDVGLADFYSRDPGTLSGGQKARVSALRALLAEPEALLLDEPFSKLDAVLRGQFRAFVFDRIATLGIPTLLVTHDPADIPPGGAVIEISEFSEWRGDYA